jgi:hypothetical protein
VTRTGIYSILALFIMPYVLIYFPGVPRRISRLVAVSAWLLLVTSGVLWFGFNLDLKIVETDSRVDLVFHVLAVAFGIWVFTALVVPLATDIREVATGKELTRFRRVVSDERAPSRAPICLVRFSPGESRYYLWFPIIIPEAGHSYEFEVLPKSRLILDFRD